MLNIASVCARARVCGRYESTTIAGSPPYMAPEQLSGDRLTPKARASAFPRECVPCACVRACVRTCARACACVRVCACARAHVPSRGGAQVDVWALGVMLWEMVCRRPAWTELAGAGHEVRST